MFELPDSQRSTKWEYRDIFQRPSQPRAFILASYPRKAHKTSTRLMPTVRRVWWPQEARFQGAPLGRWFCWDTSWEQLAHQRRPSSPASSLRVDRCVRPQLRPVPGDGLVVSWTGRRVENGSDSELLGQRGKGAVSCFSFFLETWGYSVGHSSGALVLAQIDQTQGHLHPVVHVRCSCLLCVSCSQPRASRLCYQCLSGSNILGQHIFLVSGKTQTMQGCILRSPISEAFSASTFLRFLP